MMQQAAIVVLAYVDPAGVLKVCASDVEGKWQSNVDFLPASLSLDEQGTGLNYSLRPWKRRGRPRVEKLTLTGMNPMFLNDAKLLVRKKLEGVEVVVTEAGILLVDRNAQSRERVETARLWLSLAGQYVGLSASVPVQQPT